MKRFVVCVMSWLFLSSIVFSYDLRLTEVLVDGTDEFVEISNMSSDPFVGSLTLSGAKASSVNLTSITIPARSSLIVGDNLAMITNLSLVSYIAGLGLNFPDTNGVNLSLWQGTTLLDSFGVSTGDVNAIDNTKTSFHKQFLASSSVILPSVIGLSFGLNPGFIGHPGRVYDSNGLLLIPQATLPPITGSTSGASFTVDCATLASGIVSVSEIHDGGQYSDYIEILFEQDRVGGLELSGNAVSQSFTIPSQSRHKNTRYLIASSLSGFHHSSHIVLVLGLDVSTGVLVLSSLSQQNLFFALVDTGGQSVYPTTNYNCLYDFASLGSPSPGFDEDFLPYLNMQTLTTTIVQTITGSCVSTGQTTSTGSVLFTGSLSFGDVRISMIDYDPPGSDTNKERISFISLTGTLPLSDFSLSYDNKTYNFSTGWLLSGQETTITGNFVFVNSRTVCVALYHGLTLIDTACYDPSVTVSPLYPLQTGSVAGTGQTSTGLTNEDIDYPLLEFDLLSLDYDPPGSDTNNESVVIYFSGGASGVLLDNLRLRVGTSNKRIYGLIQPGETKTLVGNFQMPNSSPTCVALTYQDIVYDEYCYNPIVYTAQPPSPSPMPSPEPTVSNLYRNHHIALVDASYNPDGNDTDRETVTLLMTGNQPDVDLSKLSLRFGSTKRQLNGYLIGSGVKIITGNFQMPNSKPTCIDLIEADFIFDTYCYDPSLAGTVETQLSGDLLSLSGELLSPQKEGTDRLDDTDRLDEYTGLQLDRILPNPEGKDIKNDNEKFALRWVGMGETGQTRQMLTKHVKLVIGKTTISLSGFVFNAEEGIIIASKSLLNSATCARLLIDKTEIDKICYPQAKEGQIYYHERFGDLSQSLPNSLIDSLDAQGVDLSQLKLKKSGSQICLVYDTVSVRCMAAGSSKTSLKNKNLLILANAYISQMSTLVHNKDIRYTEMDKWKQSYRDLAALIKQGVPTITLRGHTLDTTALEEYKALVYDRSPEDIVLDTLVYNLFGSIL